VQIIRPEMFTAFSAPSVYRWRRGSETLYVGMSTQVLARLNSHEIVGSVEPFQADDAIEVYSCASSTDARHKEAAMIAELRPKYNAETAAPTGYCLRCGKPFEPRGKWPQQFCSKTCRDGRKKEANIRRKQRNVENGGYLT
jgi:predicted GIY-YIG superfamily endonuclease/predicted nucleic acid-binding Zn ribbon protein